MRTSEKRRTYPKIRSRLFAKLFNAKSPVPKGFAPMGIWIAPNPRPMLKHPLTGRHLLANAERGAAVLIQSATLIGYKTKWLWYFR